VIDNVRDHERINGKERKSKKTGIITKRGKRVRKNGEKKNQPIGIKIHIENLILNM